MLAYGKHRIACLKIKSMKMEKPEQIELKTEKGIQISSSMP